MPGVVTYDAKREMFVVAFPYNPGMVKAMSRVPAAAFDKLSRQWVVPPTSAVPLLGYTNDYRMRMAPTVRRLVEETAAKEQTLTDLSKASDDQYDGLPDVPLLPYQRAAVAYALRTRRCFIADEMGLGKTLSATAAVVAADAFPALIVTPALLKLNWQREIMRWFPGRTVEILYGKKPKRVPPAEFVIINYDVLTEWEEMLMRVGFRASVMDESHYIRNTSKRSLAMRHLAKAVPTDGLRLALTGTPVWLETKDLWLQLEALGRDMEFGYPFFNKRYVKTKHPDELHDRLRATCYIRRLKSDVMKELPAKRRAPLTLELANLKEYREAETDVVKYLSDKAAAFALELGEDPHSAAVRAKMRASAAVDLVRIANLKRLAAEAKVPDAVAWIRNFLTTGKKLVVFAHHRSVIAKLSEALGGALQVVGGQDVRKRQDAVDTFQQDPDAKVIVCALTAAGVGITLTAASDVLFLELGWTAAGHDQCEDRCHRIGQHDSVTAWYLLADGTIDTPMNWDLLASRRIEMEAVTDGKSRTPPSDGNMGVAMLMNLAGFPDADDDEADDDDVSALFDALGEAT
jgi:SWI/SNF-related matrix-associated actin-dependent regulator 1 of chromatin subfamily A